MKEYHFDEIADRKVDHCRKWDRKIVEEKFGDVPENFIPMWIADMDFKAAPEINEAFRKIIDNGAYGYTYTYEDFFNAVMNWQKKRHGNEVNKEWITLSYGTVSTIHYLYQAFCPSNGKVMFNTPVYNPFSYAAKNNQFETIHNQLIYENYAYRIDFSLLEEQLKVEKPQLFLFCSPHNPSGKIWRKDELERIAFLCKKYGTLLVVDEVHSEIILSGEFTSALQLPEKYLDNLVVLTSPNKAFNLGGLKTSYSIIPDESKRSFFQQQLKMNAITSPNAFGVTGLIAAYDYGEEWLEQLTLYLRQNYDFSKQFIEKNIANWKVVPVEASYLPWIDISETGKTSLEWVDYLAKKAGVIIEPGNNFTADGNQFLRINIGTSRVILEEALKRIKNCQDEFGPKGSEK
ncbi:MalY/PatB family protein [Enterococcus sp. C50]|uniref:MalY/PatB family protein n=1 Tax=Enterococcus sp. C50 TaxID=3231311 RepID=UPI0034A02785